MPLQRQVVSIPMSGTLDTKTDPKQLPTGKLLEMENGFRKRHGELQKRYGFETLGTTITPSGTLSQGRKMALFYDELNVITNKSMYTYSDDNNNWVLKGPLETLSVASQPIVANSYQQTTADSGTAGSIALYAWEDSRTANTIRYSIMDRSSNSIIIGDALLATNAQKPHVIGLSDFLFVFYHDSVAGLLNCKIFPITNLTINALTITPLQIANDIAATGNYDVCRFNEAILFAYQTNVNTQKIGYVTSNGLIGNPSNGYPSPITESNALDKADRCITIFTNSTTFFNVAWASSTDGVYHKAYNADFTTNLARVQLDSYTTTAVRNITGFTSATLAHVYWDKDNTDKWKREVVDTHRNLSTGVVSPGAGNLRTASLAGKIFYTDDNGFVPVAFYSNTQPSLFLLRNDGDISAKMLAQTSAGETAKTGHLPSITNTEGNVWVFPTTYKTRIVSENATLYGLTGITEVILDFDDQFICDSSQLGENLMITSGYLQCYDGVSIFESGFHLYPDHITATQNAVTVGPFLNNQKYQYCVVYEWTDSRGQVHRSAPSIPISITFSLNNVSCDINIPYLYITDRKAPRADVVLAVYRTTNGGTLFYKTTSISSPQYNNTTAVGFTLTFTDTTTDAALITNELLYTTGGVVENIAPPAAKIIARFKNRLFLAGTEDDSIWYSKEHVTGEAVNFSDLFKIKVDNTGGKITSLGELDDKLIIFKATTIFALTGDGPLPTGAQNTFSIPQLIASDVGCIDPYSVVKTRNGLMFKSKKGIYLLDRGLQVSYVGAEVEEWNSFTITSATVVDELNQVRFTTSSGRCLVYDLFFQQWYTFTNIAAIDAAVWQSKWVFLKSDAEIRRETPNVYLDVDSPIISKFTLALMQFAQVQGFQRIFKLNVLGENRGTHGLKIEVGYDYRDYFEERFIVFPNTVLQDTEWGGEPAWGESETLWGGDSDGVYQFQIRPRQQRCQALKLKIEDFFNTGSGTAGFALSNVTAEVGIEPNIARLSKTKIIAP